MTEHSLDAAATFDEKAEGSDFKAGKQSSPEVTDSKHDLESPRADHLRDADNDNLEKEGDQKTEEEEAASEDRQLSNSPASSRKRRRKISGEKVLKVVLQPSIKLMKQPVPYFTGF